MRDILLVSVVILSLLGGGCLATAGTDGPWVGSWEGYDNMRDRHIDLTLDDEGGCELYETNGAGVPTESFLGHNCVYDPLETEKGATLSYTLNKDGCKTQWTCEQLGSFKYDSAADTLTFGFGVLQRKG